MATGIEVIIATLLVLAIPFFLAVVWLVRRNRERRCFALELKNGNKIFSEWQQTGTNQNWEQAPPR